MGEHKKNKVLACIEFFHEVGEILGYAVTEEEYMFPSEKTSPILDMAWRRNSTEKFPLFIFEFESIPTKSAPDNVLKVFSRKTNIYPKPLFFFHVFVEQKMDTDRIKSLQENYDKLNYSAYSLIDKTASAKLFYDVLEQHFRISQSLDFLSLLSLFENDCPLDIEIEELCQMLIELGFDQIEGSRFLEFFEQYLYFSDNVKMKDFYLDYIEKFIFSYNHKPWPDYEISTSTAYSEVPHLALLKLFSSDERSLEKVFKQLRIVEDRFKPWPLWEPNFGLSRDYDNVLLFEFPIYLTMLCVSFKNTKYGFYFSRKLHNIMRKSKYPKRYNLFGWIWLLIASQISNDELSYKSAQQEISQEIGFNLGLMKNLVFVTEEISVYEEPYKNIDLILGGNLIPDFSEWSTWIQPYLSQPEKDLLKSIIGVFFLIEHFEQSKIDFLKACLLLSTT